MNIKITFKQLEDWNCASVTDYCRLLISENKRDYSGDTVEVYRGDMLCLTVTDISTTAKLQPNGIEFVKYHPPLSKRIKRPNKAVALAQD